MEEANRSTIDKEKAISLRESGKSYKEISEELNRSIDWCKRNLKGTKKKDIEQDDYKELVDKGRSRECITKGDIFSKLIVDYSEEDALGKEAFMKARKNQGRRVKDRLSKEEGVIIRQAWIHPDRARQSFNNMLMYINMLNDVLDEYVRSHLAEVGFEDDKNYDSALAFLILNSQFGQRIYKNYSQGVFEAIEKAVDKVEERNGSIPYELPFKDAQEVVNMRPEELPY